MLGSTNEKELGGKKVVRARYTDRGLKPPHLCYNKFQSSQKVSQTIQRTKENQPKYFTFYANKNYVFISLNFRMSAKGHIWEDKKNNCINRPISA